MMFRHAFILLSFAYSTSCSILCYDCSSAPEEYNYIITSDKIPKEIRNCPAKQSQTGCGIDIRWDLTANMTRIKFQPDDRESTALEQNLTVNAVMSGIGVSQQIETSFYYYCRTDQCNHISIFQRILKSVIITAKFSQLSDLLTPDQPFSGSGCFRYVNQTGASCTSKANVNPNDCTQCFTTFTTQSKIDTICSTCLTDYPLPEKLGRTVLFNFVDRTYISTWFIRCQSKSCNAISTGRRIYDNSRISFDFNSFLGYNGSHRKTISSSYFLSILFIFKSIYKAFH